MLDKVPVTELRPDMYIHAFCARWIDHPLFRSGFVLQRQDELKKILASGMAQLWVDTAKGAGPGTGVERPAVPVRPDLRPTVPQQAAPPAPSRAEALHDAARMCRSSIPKVAALFGEARMGKAINTALVPLEILTNPAS
jgi:hypothetical protein